MTTKTPKVAVLMGSYDGGEFLREQLDSIWENDHKDWTLWVSDDGSGDDTLSILEEYQRTWGREKLRILKGPGKGFCKNFLSLTDNPDIKADYYVWCDQDDLWMHDKIARALEFLEPLEDKASLYCGRTLYVDAKNNELGLSPLREKPPPTFANALVQSLAGANTMTFNDKARELIRKGNAFPPASHDWWAYQIVAGAGGAVAYDSKPTLRYRQHGKNLVGSNVGLKENLRRFAMGLKGDFREWNEKQATALTRLNDYLTRENREILEAFREIRESAGFLKAIWLSEKYKIRRRSKIQQLSLYLLIFLGMV
jgi:glycosyltransferase involved in cell wall biosynthesis